MPETNTQTPKVSRRNWVKLVSGTAASAIALATACAPSEKKTMSDTKSTPPPPTKESTEVAALEKELGVHLTPEQQKALPTALKNVHESLGSLRKYHLTDGGSEPGILFTPTPEKR